MSGPKRRPAALLIARGVELLSDGDQPVTPAGVVRRDDLQPLLAGDVLGAGAVAPRFVTDLDLEERSPLTPSPPNDRPDLSANGRTILAELRVALDAGDEGRLRVLRWWFPWILRARSVHAYLDGLPPARAAQIAGLTRGRGRPTSAGDHASLIVTLDLLSAKEGSVARAAEKIALLPAACISAERLRNLHSELGPLVRCLREGYWVPASEVACPSWGQDPAEEFAVYLKI